MASEKEDREEVVEEKPIDELDEVLDDLEKTVTEFCDGVVGEWMDKEGDCQAGTGRMTEDELIAIVGDSEVAIEGLTIEELSSALADMEKSLEDLGTSFVYASIGASDLPEALNLAMEECFPAWSRHNPMLLGSKGTSVQIREMHWPERLLARLLAASMSERIPERVSDFLYWRLMLASDRVFRYYDKRHYGTDEI